MNVSCPTYGWVMPHVWMSHVTYMNESCHTYEWVTSYIWMSHVTRMNESCHTYVPSRNTILPLWHTATDFNALENTVTHCNMLQHAALHCNTLQSTATHCNTLQHTATYTLYLHAPHSLRSNTHKDTDTEHLFATATDCNILQRTAALCSTLQHCNTLQHIAARCNIHIVPACATVGAEIRTKTPARNNFLAIATDCAAKHCSTLQHIATHCNILQHTHCTCMRHSLCAAISTKTPARNTFLPPNFFTPSTYGVAYVSRIDKIIGLFRKRAL